MLGLTLSKQFYETHALPLFQKQIPDIMPLVAIGLVGEGSECFGFDDVVSQDHDFGPAFCLWLPEAEWQIWREPVEKILAQLPSHFAGLPTRMRPEQRNGRVGLLNIESFYARYISLPRPPQNWQEWRIIPEHFLATVTNGEVFHDPSQRFTHFRNALLNYYPEDIRLKKIAARCAIMAQTGQYNLIRSAKRSQKVSSMLCISRFAEAALSLTFLCNKRYMPFYKWGDEAVQYLPILGEETHLCLENLSGISWSNIQVAIDVIENYCSIVSKSLRSQGLSNVHDTWLLAHATAIQSKIQIPQLRELPEMAE